MAGRGRRALWIGLGVLGALGAAAFAIYGGGTHEGPGEITGAAASADIVAARAARQAAVVTKHPAGERPASGRQILFGDLHVHTTYSVDAFMMSLPLVGGEGTHPPADACDYARHCSSLDFFSFNDHAEGLTPEHWRETVDTARRCNAVAGDPDDPDLVVYAGWEWTQVGATPREHYGHKNVVLRDLDEGRVPTRPIAAGGAAGAMRVSNGGGILRALAVPLLDFSRRQRYLDYAQMMREIRAVPDCPSGVDVRELPDDCREFAETPDVLFEKLAQWDVPALVIPHGTTWGLYTPAGYTYDKQIAPAQHDPSRQRLIEVYSGHGNSEEYRPFRSAEWADGTPSCPEPVGGHEPCCWRAGEIVRSRCAQDGVSAADCEARVAEAQANYLAAGMSGYLTVPDADLADWKDCDACVDCFNPSMGYRSGGSVQYILARGSFADDGAASYAPMGFIASSDNHTARPGTGYKEIHRGRTTEARGAPDPAWRARLVRRARDTLPEAPNGSRSLGADDLAALPPFALAHFERQASFFMTGGLVAVHSDGRDRGAIWDALQRREVYGTSGDRILLWFDLQNGPSGRAPMGAAVTLTDAPRFVVRAAGSFEQLAGCPDDARQALGEERLDRLCGGECYNPGDRRRAITRIEVVRIRPQVRPDEAVESLIEDPWRTLPCPSEPAGCRVEFEDPDYPAGARDVIYYARAIQEPTPAINAAGVRCTRDADDRCVEAQPCYGDHRTSPDDDCLADNEERAWSSPIFVRHPGS